MTQREKIENIIAGMESEAERRLANIANSGKGGMQVPFHGDLANAPISTVHAVKKWARWLRQALETPDAS